MSRNSAGEFSLPVGNPVVVGTTIDATWANPTMNEMATALTDSLDRTGKGAMLAPLKLEDGTEALPSLSFNDEPNTGMYLFEPNNVQYSISGVRVFRLFNQSAALWNVTAAEWRGIVASNNITVNDDGSITFDATSVVTYEGTVNHSATSVVTYEGAVTFTDTTTVIMEGDTTITGPVDLGDTVTVEGETLNTYVTNVSEVTPVRPAVITNGLTSLQLDPATHEGAVILFTNAVTCNFDVRLSATVPVEIGFIVNLYQMNTPRVVIVPEAGVTINSAISLETRTQYSSISLICTGIDEWMVVGDQYEAA